MFNHIIADLNEHVYLLLNRSDEASIAVIKGKLNNIANILECIPKLSREFLDFLKIKKMLVFILNNYSSLKSQNLNIFFDLINSFHKLLVLKISFLKNSKLKNQYLEGYCEFKSQLKDSSEEFHRNIYQRLDVYDDLMCKVSEILIE